MTPRCTCRALWLVSMSWFLKQAMPRLSGKLPVFQSDVAPLSITHCNNKETEKRTYSGGLSYLPGRMTHGHAMPPHAVLTTVIWRVSYLIVGGGSTVYPPLVRAQHREQQHRKDSYNDGGGSERYQKELFRCSCSDVSLLFDASYIHLFTQWKYVYIFLCCFNTCTNGAFYNATVSYLINDPLVHSHFPENCFSNGGSANIPCSNTQHTLVYCLDLVYIFKIISAYVKVVH